jgi:hypothetical protein
VHSVINPRVRKTVGCIAALACVATFAAPGVAWASSPSQTLSTPFSQSGDTSSYVLIPGSSSQGDPGWTLPGASLTADPYRSG